MSEIDNINIEYDNQIDSIDIEYVNEVQSIFLTLGEDVQSVFSVNNLTGNISLTYSEILGPVSPTSGVFSYQINHNLNYLNPIVSVYNSIGRMFIVDVGIFDNNSVIISSLVDLSNYRVVVQR